MSEFDPAQPNRSFFPPARPDTFDAEELVEAEALQVERPAAGLREGLPPGFRMRHDAHYVDQLTSRPTETIVRTVSIREIDRPDAAAPTVHPELVTSVRELGILQPLLVRRRNGRFEVIAGNSRLAAAMAAGLTEVPCLVHQVDDATARTLAEADNMRPSGRSDASDAGPVETAGSVAVVQELTRNLTTVSASLGLLADRGQSFRDRLAMELARAELQRAIWLLQATEVLAGEVLIVRREFRAGALIERVVAALGPERRLSGVQIVSEIADAGLLVSADEDLVSVAVAGMLEALLAVLQRSENSRLTIRAIGRATPPALVLEAWQETVTLPATLAARFFDPSWTDRPGGLTAGLGLAAARKVAALHGGQIDLTAGERGGCRLHFMIPTVT